ncbi:MAG: hypothetical protein AUJ47_13190 [Candidatus Marinimicrobia bacterium CG1_02_48_14]|nr:MAG: hypothetical protein AUJ47_13190 [Candidatus Marinimicrobia bacterium CG1_02_48_14]PJA53463.1 MAG: hypothetical protein CO167_07315 [Candidatus Marinimicrobia bacterium CG_4_9_14_3_um_filter_48_9]
MVKIPISLFEDRLARWAAGSGRHRRFDSIMIAASNPYQWIWAMILFFGALIYFDWRDGLAAMAIGSAAAGLSDAINSKLIKKHTDRWRPSKTIREIKPLGIMNSGKKSFPSNHATNTAAFAASVGIYFPFLLWFFIPLTLLVGYSRLYCGAHYLLDVVVGWLHGASWAVVFYFLLESTLRLFEQL